MTTAEQEVSRAAQAMELALQELTSWIEDQPSLGDNGVAELLYTNLCNTVPVLRAKINDNIEEANLNG